VFYKRQGLCIPTGYLPVIGHHLLIQSDKDFNFVKNPYSQNKGIVPFTEGFQSIVYVGDALKAQQIID
jgi:hypothetical protein